MEYLWATGLVLLNGIWLFLVVLGLPGNWLMVLSTVMVAWLHWDQGMFRLETLVAIAGLAAAGEVLRSSPRCSAPRSVEEREKGLSAH